MTKIRSITPPEPAAQGEPAAPTIAEAFVEDFPPEIKTMCMSAFSAVRYYLLGRGVMGSVSIDFEHGTFSESP